MSRSVFISYSREDAEWMEQVLKPLEALSLHCGAADPWVDTAIGTGADWRSEIDQAMDQASAAILLISTDFLHSKFIKEYEVPRLLERRRTEGLPIFPVLIKPCSWMRVDWLEEMQVFGGRSEPLAALSELELERHLARLAEQIDDRLELERARNRQAASGSGVSAPEVGSAGHLGHMVRKRGDAEPILYTFCGLKPADPGPPASPSVGISSVLRLWADPSHEGNSIQTTLGADEDRDYFRVRYRTEPGSFPCDVTLRPCGFQPLVNTRDQPLLAFDARGAPTDDTPGPEFVQGLSVRLIDRFATQWRKGEESTDSIDLPLDGQWYTLFVDLRRHWALFGSDGNHRYAGESLDPSLIAALVVELGGRGGHRLGAGAAQVDLANIRLADAPTDEDLRLRGRLRRSG